MLPGVTLGAQLRLRTESRRNFKFDETRPGNDEGFLLSRFRLGLTWEPSDVLTGVVELQDARIDGEAARQTGRYGGSPHRALMVHVGGSFTTALPGKPRIGAASNFGSGDDDPGDGVHGTFDNLYPLNHVYYGYMDLFALQNLRNLEVSVETALPGGSSLRVAWQDFTLAAPGAGAYLRDTAFKHRSADFFYLQTVVGF